MTTARLSIPDLRDRIHAGEAMDPLVFLESVMSGQDPRRLSKLYDLVSDINDFSGGNVCKEDWQEVVEEVSKYHKFVQVSISEYHGAANTLAQYLHPKRKQIELNGALGSGQDLNSSPLSEEEIELFKERFNDEF